MFRSGSRIIKYITAIGIFYFCFFIFAFSAASALTLSESIEIALAKNPQIVAAQHKVKAATGKLGQARSSIIPHISLEGAFGKIYQESPTIDFSIPGMPTMEGLSLYPDEAADSTSYAFSLKQPLFTGGKIFRSLRMANAGYHIANEDFRKAQNEVTYNVTSAYYNVLKAEKMVALTKEGMDTLKKHLKQVEMFHKAGVVTKADVLRVETELANLKQAEIQARNGLKLAKAAFNSLLGKNLSEDVSLSPEILTAEEKGVDSDYLLSTAYSFRPEWKAFKLGKKIGEDSVGLAYSGYFPNLAFMGSTGKTITDYPAAGTKYDLDSWRLMVAGSWNLFDGFETPNKVLEAHANLEALKAQEQLIKDGVALEVNSAHLDLESASERVAAAEVAENLAKRSLHYAEVNFATHIDTSLSVLDAEAALHKAQTNLWSAKYDVELAKAKINKAVGTNIL